MTFLWSIFGFIIAISLLVTVHEYGHFWAARRCGIKIERFSLGFGKVLWAKKDKYGTEFALSAIPLGGYVKMLDERQETVPSNLKKYAFNHKPLWQRMFVVSAGPLANFLLAIVLYTAMFMLGVPNVRPVIENIQAHSIAAEAKIPKRVEIIEVDGEAVQDWESINMLLASKIGQEKVRLTLRSEEGYLPTEHTLNLSHWHFDTEKESAVSSLGLEPVRTKILMQLSKVNPNSPASEAGLQEGDTLFQANGAEFNWQEFAQLVKKGVPFKVQVQRHGEKFGVMLYPKKKDGRFILGVAPKIEEIAPEYRNILQYDFIDATKKGIEKTVQLSWVTLKVIGKLFTGDLSLKNLSGPISIAKGAGVMVQIGFVYYLGFLALISVNLGIMNLLPLPVLDGGHLVFLTLEGIQGKPLSEKTQQTAYRVGASLLLTLTIFALFNDFLRL